MKSLSKKLVIVILLIVTTVYFTSCKKEAEEPIPPAVLTFNVSSISETSAKVEGAVNGNGGTDVIDEGVCWNTSGYPTTANSKISAGNGPENFICSLTDLIPGTTYYARAYAINSAGTGYGSQVTFVTNQIIAGPTIPILSTISVGGITVEHAFSGGDITDDGNDAVTESGICWASNPNPTTGNFKRINTNGGRAFVSYIDSLHPSTKYYVRAYATNGVGTAYGDELSFTTLAVSPIIFNPDLTYGSVSDIDGNIYKTIQIGTQLWMAENLKTTKYNEGTLIPNVTDNTEWCNLTTPGYSWYNNDAASYKDTYGALYNWHAVVTGDLCPAGWHVPADTEWSTLITYLGGEDVTGVKLTETGITHLLSYMTGTTNESGFTGLPGGSRYFYESYLAPVIIFSEIQASASWWSATEDGVLNARRVLIYWDDVFYVVQSAINKIDGMSVRCLKD
jgi:uncharacterized protein (TIGR02145 family)